MLFVKILLMGNKKRNSNQPTVLLSSQPDKYEFIPSLERVHVYNSNHTELSSLILTRMWHDWESQTYRQYLVLDYRKQASTVIFLNPPPLQDVLAIPCIWQHWCSLLWSKISQVIWILYYSTMVSLTHFVYHIHLFYFIIQTLDMMKSNEWLEWLFFKGKIVYTLMKTNT